MLASAKARDTGETVEGYLFEDIAVNRHISYIIKGGFVPAISMPTGKFREIDRSTLMYKIDGKFYTEVTIKNILAMYIKDLENGEFNDATKDDHL